VDPACAGYQLGRPISRLANAAQNRSSKTQLENAPASAGLTRLVITLGRFATNVLQAEVLCDRLGIFVDGQLVCIGAPKEITARYGGYLVRYQYNELSETT